MGRSPVGGGYQADRGRNVENLFETVEVVPARQWRSVSRETAKGRDVGPMCFFLEVPGGAKRLLLG